ncbi:hypothetical protein EVAR_67379_1 [Eumeta japonica]|uniref:Uncharacterized protein n=1 Tax=Eumeta variegata TaxID=151549 RepID=A0A4C2AH96_EUMVA|nr:hypothetical protein EVAR_67379_1 [Eumeta japonica]
MSIYYALAGGVVIEREGMRERKERGRKRKFGRAAKSLSPPSPPVELKTVKVVDAEGSDEGPFAGAAQPSSAADGDAEARERFINKFIPETRQQIFPNDPDKMFSNVLNRETKHKGRMYRERGNELDSKYEDYEIFLNKEPKVPHSVKSKEKYRIYLKKNKRNTPYAKIFL